MSCRNVGFAARRLKQAFASSPLPLSIITSRSDSPAVCSFVRAERLQVPVLAVPDSLFLAATGSDSLSLALLDVNSQSFRILRAKDGLDLLSLVSNGLPDAATPPPAP